MIFEDSRNPENPVAIDPIARDLLILFVVPVRVPVRRQAGLPATRKVVHE
jgi:hypothetical protein